MRWMLLVVLGCAGPTSYQSRVADITDDSAPASSRTPSVDESQPRGRSDAQDARQIVRVRMVRDLSDATAIHGSCALRENGDVRCWGEGPEVPAIRGASTVAMGGYYGNTVCAVQRGRVTCWYPAAEGRTEYRARGVNGATKVVAGRELSCALVDGGQVWCWGTARPASIGVSDAVDVACGYSECCVAHEDGGVSCWSDEWSVEGCSDCGHGASPRERVDGLEGVVSLSSDPRRFCARKRNGESTCWVGAAGGHDGLQPRGALVAMRGADTADSLRPLGQVDVQGNVRLHDGDSATWSLAIGLRDVVELSDTECARLRDGRVACWGEESRYAEGTLIDPPPEVELDAESDAAASASESESSESSESEQVIAE